MRRSHHTRVASRRLPAVWPWLFTLLCVFFVEPALAQAEQAASGQPSGAKSVSERGAEGSPRAAVRDFLEACRAGNFANAARNLELLPAEVPDGATTARQLKAVLDRHVWLDLDEISSAPEGKLDDRLGPSLEEIGRVPLSAGGSEPVRLARRLLDGSERWVFSHATVERVPVWYEHLEHRWALEHLPRALLKVGPRDLLYWQWLALPVLFLIAWLLGYLLDRITLAVVRRLVSRTQATWDDELLERIGGPLTAAWALISAYALIPSLGLYQPAQDFLHDVLRGGLLVVFFWTLSRSIDVAVGIVAQSSWAQESGASRSLLPLGARVGKVLLIAVAAVAMLSELGYPVASLLAGLGIGGLAFALAAQKTVENLFGAFSIGADQPFREGDFVKVEDFVGTVEAIGLRSTRIRTLDRTLISIPNGRLADMRLESFAARDRFRLACTLGLVYETSVSQMRQVLADLEQTLRSHPKIWPEAVVVRFAAFADSSLNIDIMAWFEVTDWNEFMEVRQDILLQFMEVVERAGSSFAFPTRTVHLVKADA